MPSTEPDASVIHVAVGVIEGQDGRILLTRRPEHVHQGGKWEFPGGKLEDGESVEQALKRELQEELGICPVQISPLISIPFLYPDKHVLLDVWVVSQFSGLPHAREGQPMSWVARQDLHQLEFPQANRPIIQALNLPERILISPPGLTEAELIDGVRSSLIGSKPGMVYLRTSESDTVSQKTISDLRSQGCRVITGLNHLGLATEGIHLKSRELMSITERPDVGGRLVSASCHSPEEIEKANQLQLDFIFLSPVRETTTHPEARALGWSRFATLVRAACMPVYALGGMTAKDVSSAKSYGGQGIAAITGLWAMDS